MIFARLLVALRLPTGDEDARPQYRGVRGFYRKSRAASIAAQRARLKVVE
jgi:hypothetical protein